MEQPIFWHKDADPKSKRVPRVRLMDQVEFVGVTDLSVEVWLTDGTRIRVTNPEFLQGLKIEIHKTEEKVQ